jgi:hypothetical protein
VTVYRELRFEFAAGKLRRSCSDAFDTPRQRRRTAQAESDRQKRREEQHRQQHRKVVTRNKHRLSSCEHHADEQQAADEADTHELSPHAPDASEYGGLHQQQRQHPACTADNKQ